MTQACGAGMGQGGVGSTEIMDGAGAVAAKQKACEHAEGAAAPPVGAVFLERVSNVGFMISIQQCRMV
jgi:hypothetical protein